VPEHSQGIDADKKIKGCRRHAATDVLSLLFVVLVTAASVQDTTGGRTAVERVAALRACSSTEGQAKGLPHAPNRGIQ
jgi:hypothetical protein